MSGHEIAETVSSDAEHAPSAPDAEDPVYRRMLRASALIGMSTAFNVGVGIIRTKAMAMLLGPAGFGLMGLYSSICDVTVSIAGMGVNNSGVRQIADAASSDSPGRIARTAIVLRRVSVILGLLGAGALVLLASPISILTFGDDRKASAIAVLALAVLLRLIAAGQGALLQGMRRIADMAKISVASAVLATAVSVPIVYFLHEDGVALSLVAIAAMSTAAYWWYTRNLHIEAPKLSIAEVAAEGAGLLKLGLAFMLSGFLMMGSAYAVRLIIARDLTLEAAGLYSSAWTLGGLYVGYVLQAMGADFYPQLVGVAQDHERCNRLVNDQTLVSLLLAGPGILATITFAPVVIALLYSLQFTGAVEVLRLICAGMAMRVITWPMGFIIVAKNRQLLFLAVDFGWTLANVGLTWLLVSRLGLAGAGVSFLVSYLLHALAVYPIARRLTGFEWSDENRRIGALYLLSVAGVLTGAYILTPIWAFGLGALITFGSACYSLQKLLDLLSANGVPPKIARLLEYLRLGVKKSRQEAASGDTVQNAEEQ